MIDSTIPRPLDTPWDKHEGPESGTGTPAGKGGAVKDTPYTEQQISDLMRILRDFGTRTPGAPGDADEDAPDIEAPSLCSTEEEFTTKVGELLTKTAETGLQTGTLNLNISQRKISEQTNLRLSKMKEANSKEASAASRKKTHGILGWLKRVAMPVAMGIGLAMAIAAAVATGGAATPLVAIMLASAIAGSSLGLANSISSEVGGPPIEIASHLAKGMATAASLISEDVFHHHLDPAEAKNIGLVASGYFGASLALVDPQFGAQLTVGIAGLAGTKDEEKLALINMAMTTVTTIAVGIASAIVAGAGAKRSLDRVLMMVAGITQGVATGTAGAGQVGQGVIGIENAFDLRAADLLRADGKRIQAYATRMQAALEGMQNELQKVYENLSAGLGTLSDILKDNNRIRTQLIESRPGPTA